MPVRPDWQRFDELDCETFAGAEPFANGDEPWIAEIEVDGQPALAMVDATRVAIVIDGEEQFVARDMNALLGLGARTSKVELARLGFRSTTIEPTQAPRMVRVRFERFGQPDPVPTWLDASVRGVPADPFANVDEGQGGITFADIEDETMIAPLGTFAVGAGVYVESDDPHEALEDETEESEARTHIWWRAVVVEQ